MNRNKKKKKILIQKAPGANSYELSLANKILKLHDDNHRKCTFIGSPVFQAQRNKSYMR